MFTSVFTVMAATVDQTNQAEEDEHHSVSIKNILENADEETDDTQVAANETYKIPTVSVPVEQHFQSEPESDVKLGKVRATSALSKCIFCCKAQCLKKKRGACFKAKLVSSTSDGQKLLKAATLRQDDRLLAHVTGSDDRTGARSANKRLQYHRPCYNRYVRILYSNNRDSSDADDSLKGLSSAFDKFCTTVVEPRILHSHENITIAELLKEFVRVAKEEENIDMGHYRRYQLKNRLLVKYPDEIKFVNIKNNYPEVVVSSEDRTVQPSVLTGITWTWSKDDLDGKTCTGPDETQNGEELSERVADMKDTHVLTEDDRQTRSSQDERSERQQRQPCSLTINSDIYDIWCLIRKAEGLNTDAETAKFLIQQYDNCKKGSHSHTTCITCLTPLMLCCPKCGDAQAANRHSPRSRAKKSGPRLFVKKKTRGRQRKTVAEGAHLTPVTRVVYSSVNVNGNCDLLTMGAVNSTGSCRHNGVKDFSDEDVKCHFEPQAQSLNISQQTLDPEVKVEAEDIFSSDQKMSLSVQESGLGVTVKEMAPQSGSTCHHKLSSAKRGLPLRKRKAEPKSDREAQEMWVGSESDEDEKLSDMVKSHPKKNRKTHHACKVCLKIFRSFLALKKHMHNHKHPQNQSDGGALNPLEQASASTVNNIGGCVDKAVKCKYCSSVFNNKNSFTAHEKKHKGDMPFPCDVCSLCFMSAEDRDKHLQTHTCQQCGKKYKRLKPHMQLHSGEKPFMCRTCGCSFTWESSLKRHLSTACANRGELRFICEVCGDAFKNKIVLKKHLRTHSSDKPYVCNICNSAFRSKNWLKMHLQRHRGEKPHVCEQCGQAFLQASKLKLHKLRNHTMEKPHVCKLCGFACSSGSNLTCHIRRRHSQDRRFKCEFCPYSCCERTDLVLHTRTHTGEKPFSCDLCTATFARRDYLKKHTATHTGNTPFVCNDCGVGFRHSVSLKRHLDTHSRRHSEMHAV